MTTRCNRQQRHHATGKGSWCHVCHSVDGKSTRRFQFFPHRLIVRSAATDRAPAERLGAMSAPSTAACHVEANPKAGGIALHPCASPLNVRAARRLPTERRCLARQKPSKTHRALVFHRMFETAVFVAEPPFSVVDFPMLGKRRSCAEQSVSAP